MTRKTLIRDKHRDAVLSDPRYVRCWRKRAYPTREAAERGMTEREPRVLMFTGLSVYPCREKTKKIKGLHWHIGHDRSTPE